MEPIRLEDFKDIQLYISDDEYGSDDPFKEKIQLKAKAPKLAQLRGRPKKRRIRKTTEERPSKKYRCSHCGQLGHNRKGCRNGRKELEVLPVNSEESGEEGIEETSSEEGIEETSSNEGIEGISSEDDKDELA
jgi:hypothetical protein